MAERVVTLLKGKSPQVTVAHLLRLEDGLNAGSRGRPSTGNAARIISQSSVFGTPGLAAVLRPIRPDSGPVAERPAHRDQLSHVIGGVFGHQQNGPQVGLRGLARGDAREEIDPDV